MTALLSDRDGHCDVVLAKEQTNEKMKIQYRKLFHISLSLFTDCKNCIVGCKN